MAETVSYEDIISLQRKEKKDLLVKIQKLKHSIPKNDKKKKKEITAEIAQMMADLDFKQEEQLKEYKVLESSNTLISDEQLNKDSSEISLENVNSNSNEDTENLKSLQQETSNSSSSAQKLSKAQKRRNKKSQQQKEREKNIAEQEIENLTGLRHLESLKICKKLSDRGLIIHEVPSDGNCLYKAIEHQLSTHNLKETTVTSLRGETSKYLLTHKEEYLPFLTHPDTGNILSDEEFEKYCDDIMNTPAWGGQIETKILSCLCDKPIEIIQADGPDVIIGDNTTDPRLIISYHRHAYGLGEHYNSVIPAK